MQESSPEMNSSALSAAKTQLRSLMKQRLRALSPDAVTAQSKQVFESLTSFAPYAEARRVGVYLSMPGGEVQTDAIVRHALAAGKDVFVPYLHRSGLPAGEGPARLMDMVRLDGVADYEGLARDKWGIPSVDAATVGRRQRSVGEIDGAGGGGGISAGSGVHVPADGPLDLILLPGVAFDIDPGSKAVRRLGHGKGFYDYFLHRYALATSSSSSSSPPESGQAGNENSGVLLYALALKEQLLSPESGESVPVGPHDQPIDGVFLGDGRLTQSGKE